MSNQVETYTDDEGVERYSHNDRKVRGPNKRTPTERMLRDKYGNEYVNPILRMERGLQRLYRHAEEMDNPAGWKAYVEASEKLAKYIAPTLKAHDHTHEFDVANMPVNIQIIAATEEDAEEKSESSEETNDE